MRVPRRRFLQLAASAAALCVPAAAATAQSYPSRPITIIVPTTAGGPPDTIARLLGERMRPTLGQPIIVENVTGAGGTIAIGRTVRAEPDGHTVGIGHLNSHVFGPATYPVSFDMLNDLGAPWVDMKYLSMGMTNSYRVAIEEGSNMVRIGTGVFGERVE